MIFRAPKLNKHAKPRAVVINDTSIDNHHGCSSVMKSIIHLISSNNLLLLGTVPLRQSWKNKKYKSLLDKADILIVNGEGSIHSSRDRAIDLLSISLEAEKRGIPSALINTSYFNNDKKCDFLASRFKQIYCRETLSQEELRNAGIQAKVCPDLSFFTFQQDLKNVQEAFQQAEECGLLYTDSVIHSVAKNLYLQSSLHQDNLFLQLKTQQNKNALIEYATRMFTAQNGRKFFKSFGTNENKYCATLKDLAVAALTSCGIVTGRFHMVCLAISLKVPFAAVSSNTPKIEGILQDAGLSNCLISLNSSDQHITLKWPTKNFELCQNYTDVAVQGAQLMFKEIRALVS